MPFDVSGLKPLETQGLRQLNTSGLTPLDTTGLTRLDNDPLEPLRAHAQSNIDRGTTVRNPDGSTSTVRSGSVEDSRLNGGRPTLIPFVWEGRIVDPDEAIRRAIESGTAWPAFDSNDQATEASKLISESIRVPTRTTGDSWADIGRKILTNAPTMFKQAGAGMLQALVEAEPTPPAAIPPGDPQWESLVLQPHRALVAAAREAGELPGQKLFDEATAELQANAPDVDPESLKAYAYDIGQGIIQMIPAVAASFATRQPGVGASIIGMQVYGPRYAESRRMGRSEEQATADAAFYGAAEAIPEMIPLGVLMKPGRSFLGRVFKTAGAEAIQEMMTEAVQSGYDAGVLDEDMTWRDAVQRLVHAGIVGAGVGGGLAVATQPFAPQGQEAPPDAEEHTADEVLGFARERVAELEAQDQMTAADQTERDTLINNMSRPEVIARAYGVKLAPGSEPSHAPIPAPSADDIASPIPTELIQQGRQVIADALEGRPPVAPEVSDEAQETSQIPEVQALQTTPPTQGRRPAEPDEQTDSVLDTAGLTPLEAQLPTAKPPEEPNLPESQEISAKSGPAFSEEQTNALRGLAQEAGWAEIGGKIIRDETGEVTGRTKWLPRADWWPGRPGKYNERQTAEIVEKGLNGERLGPKQREYFEFLQELADEMVASQDYLPTADELQYEGFEDSADSDIEMALVARATEIDEDAVERAAVQYAEDDPGFLRAVKAIVDGQQAAAAPESRPEDTRPPETDLLGDDTRAAQALADETRRRDEARNQGQESVETGDAGDLFSAAQAQTDLVDQTREPVPQGTIERVQEGEKGVQRQRKDKALKKYLLAKRPPVSKPDQVISYRTEATVGYNKAVTDGAPQEILDALRREADWAENFLLEHRPSVRASFMGFKEPVEKSYPSGKPRPGTRVTKRGGDVGEIKRIFSIKQKDGSFKIRAEVRFDTKKDGTPVEFNAGDDIHTIIENAYVQFVDLDKLTPVEETPAESADLAGQLAALDDAAIDAMVDEAVEQTGAAETEEPVKKRAKKTTRKKKPKLRKASTRPERTDIKDPAAVKRTSGEIAKSLGYNLSSAGHNALEGLTTLFGGSGKLSSGLTFDPETYAKAKPHFEAMLRDAQAAGTDLADFIRSLVEAFGSGIKPYLRQFAADLRDANAVSVTDNLERDRGVAADQESADEAADAAGQPEAAAGARPDRSETGSRRRTPESDARVLNSGAPVAGERGDQQLRPDEGQRILEGEPAGSDDGGRSNSARDQRVPPDRQGANESQKALNRADQLRAKLKAQTAANKVPVVLGDRANIDETLPYLLEGQREDVHKTETRFAQPDGYGMLFTNGTGTGKTFTGLGVVRRFASRGKRNILILAPSDKIISDWITSGEALGLELNQLPHTKTAGRGIVITTYANAGQNDALAKRDWDLVVSDEAHYLVQNKDGDLTDAAATLRAITLHPNGAYARASMLHRDLLDKLEAEQQKPPAQQDSKKIDELWSQFNEAREQVESHVEANQLEKRPRVLFLSATPFAYEKTIEWADGYLFDYNEGKQKDESRGYNVGDNREQFFMQHFGYRLRYNKLTEPDDKVDRGLMQRQFNTWLKKRGVLSGRVLDVDADYDRRFVLLESRIGNRIDALLEWTHDTEGLSDEARSAKYKIGDALRGKFDYLSRRYLLEAIKAEASVDYVRQSLDLGRKVVVFHDYKKGGGFNPFRLTLADLASSEGELAPNPEDTAEFDALLKEYFDKFSDVIDSDLHTMRSPIRTYEAEFPDVLIFNGDVSAKERRARVERFNDDATGPAVMLVQSAAGKEGISLHDITGDHQRVLINLGLPTQPTTAIQQEGRIYRVGQVTDAMFRYLNTGTSWEKWAFAQTIAQRASAAENLAQGEQARALKDSFIAAFEEADDYPPGMEGEGTGGKERDQAANNALDDFDRAVAYYYGTEKKSAKTKAREGRDYFATPEPLGLKMMEWAGVRPGEKILEPSAGHGAIARWAPTTADATAIEPSNELSARLAMVFDGDIKRQRFEDLHIVNKYDAIVMNPPFGSGGKTAIDHLDKAVKHLRDGGRVVALIPTGPAADKKFDKWYEDVEGAYLTADMSLPTVTFERAATTVAARIVVLDRVDDPTRAPQGIKRELNRIGDVRDLFERIRDMEIPERPAAPEPEPEAAAPAAPEGTYEAAQTVHSKTGEDLFVAKVVKRMPREDYLAEKDRAKQHGGWYSTFRGAGAIPGFQFKSQEARDNFIAGSADQTEQFSLAPGFYSELSRQIGALKQTSAPAAQWIGTIKGVQGVKPDEIEWSGVLDWLATQEGNVTKEAVTGFLDANGVRVEEVELSNRSQKKGGEFELSRLRAKRDDLMVRLDAMGYGVEIDPIDGDFIGLARRATTTEPSNEYVWDPDTGDFSDTEGNYLSDVDGQAYDLAGGIVQTLSDIERIAGVPDGWAGVEGGDARYESWTLPGGENYREVLLTLPLSESGRPEPLTKLPDGYETITDDSRPSDRRWGVTPPGQVHARFMGAGHPTKEAAIAEALRLVNAERESSWAVDRDRAAFRGSHFSEPNIVAHIRLKDRTAQDGSRVLFVEEIQSDWAQKGRKQGFATNPLTEVEREDYNAMIDKEVNELGIGNGLRSEGPTFTTEERARYEDYVRRDSMRIPVAPFVEKTDAWTALAFKRAMRIAVDEGYDAIAWTTGEQQAARYDLSKHLESIYFDDNSTGGAFRAKLEGEPTAGMLQARDRSGNIVINQHVQPEEIENYVGKDAAKRLLESEPAAVSSAGIGVRRRKLEGLDLKIGGEGMIAFYDNIVPKVARKAIKKLKIDQVLVNVPGERVRERYLVQPGVRITDELREQIASGLPLFSLGNSQLRQSFLGKLDSIEADLKARLQQVGIADKVGVKLVQRINSLEFGAKGKYSSYYKTIEVAANSNRAWVLDHEIIHALRDLGVIRDAEWRTLKRAALSDKAGMNEIRSRYADVSLNEEQLIEEHIADMHADWTTGRTRAQGFVRSAFERIRNFLEALGNALRGNGFQSADDIFRRIGRGEVGARATAGSQGRLAPAYSLRAGDFNPKAVAAIVAETTPSPESGERWYSTFVDEAIFRFQDKFNYLAKAQRAAARERGLGEVSEDEDAYLAELRYHGIAGAAIEDFQRDHVEPLIEAISKAGVTIEDIDRYLHARHAPEANARLKEINPDREDNDALSGMSDEDAAAVMREFSRSGKSKALADVAARADAITKAQRDLMREAGLELPESIDEWEETYEHYVPLHRTGFNRVRPGRGKGFSVTGRQKLRAGSNRAVEHILSHLIAQHEATIIRAEKNKVAQAMLTFAKNNPNKDLYEVNKVEFKPTIGPDGLIVYRPQRGFQFADNVLVVKVDGKDHTITFNERDHNAMRIAHAMKNLGADSSGPIVNTLSKVTRFLALVNTGANPEFIISNFARDLQTAGYNLSSTEADALKWQIIRDVGKSWRGIRRFQKGKGGAWSEYFDEFRKAGAQTGWLGAYDDVARRERKLARMVESMTGQSSVVKIRRGLYELEQFIEHENTAVENAIRLSAFVHARRAGISEAKAARLAKELTVNFNRKGDYGQVMNALYLFYNASIQGSARLISAATKSPKVRKLIGATIVFAAFLDMVNRALGGDDDDGRSRYDKVPDFVKERNLIIMRPGESGDYIKIPLPWGYNVFHVIGQVIGEALTKPGFRATAGAARVGATVFSAFNPVGSESSLTQLISPTITDPLVQWSENKDWTGRPLRPEGNPFDVAVPSSQQYWDSVREPSRWIAERLNELTGGSEIRPGAIDINPEAIDLLIDTFTGGAGRFITDTFATPVKALQGEDVETFEIPLLRRVYGRPGASTLRQEYYENADAIRVTELEVRHFQETGDQAGLSRLRRERRGEYGMIEARRRIERDLRRLRTARNRVEGSRLSDAQQRARLDQINRQMDQRMTQFNRLYNQRVRDL